MNCLCNLLDNIFDNSCTWLLVLLALILLSNCCCGNN